MARQITAAIRQTPRVAHPVRSLSLGLHHIKAMQPAVGIIRGQAAHTPYLVLCKRRVVQRCELSNSKQWNDGLP